MGRGRRMTTGNIIDAVLRRFLSALDGDAQLPSEVVQSFERLAEEGGLADDERVKSAVAGRLLGDDEAQDSQD